MTHEPSLKEVEKEWHGTLQAYVIGFTGSLLLTMFSFFLVIMKLLSTRNLIIVLISLAVIQAIVQLLFFMHIGKEEAKPRWATLIFCFTVLILLAVMIGSLWVMNDLNTRMMPDMSMQDQN